MTEHLRISSFTTRLLACVALISLSACDDASKVDPSQQIGADPKLPPPESALLLEDADGARVDLHENAFEWVHTALKRYWNEATGLANPSTCVADPFACLKSNETNYRVLFGTYGTFKEWPLGPDHDFDVELLGAKSLSTIWSIKANIYSEAVQLGNPDATMTQVSVGNSDDPESPYFNNTVEEWAHGQHRRTPMEQTLVEAQALERYDLVYQP